MADDDDESSKTEEPTGRKLSKAREKGNVAQSQEIKNWFTLMGATVALIWFAPWVMGKVKSIATPFIHELHSIPTDNEHLRELLGQVALATFIAVGPIFAMMVVLMLAANLVQVGLMWAPDKLQPDFSKLNIIKGMKKIISIKQMVEFVKNTLKIIIVGVVAFGLAIPMLDDIALVPDMEFMPTLDRLKDIAIWLVVGTLLVMTILAALDYMWQRYSFRKQMRMTKKEVKDEHKETEGNPEVKAKIRSLRVQRAQMRMMAAVPTADVVVTNPTHFAVVLEYKMDSMMAPRLVAKGVDSLAMRIREVAEESDVPIVENPPLARALYATVELEEEIPPEHYKAVAEIIGYVMRLRGELPPESAQPH